MSKLSLIKDYPLVELDVNDIKKDPSNPNVMTLEQSRGLEKSMLNFGRLKYIVVDQNNILIDGEHRLYVEKANGTQKIQVIQVNVKDEIERKMMRETLNKLHGEYDKQKESNELLAIFENNRLDEVAELLAQPKQNLENLISKYNPHIQFERAEDESKLPSLYDTESFVKKGEVWKLGRHILMCGDSTNKDDLDKLMIGGEEERADIIFTDPPYGIDYEYNKFKDVSGHPYIQFCLKWFPLIKQYSDLLFITTGWKYRDFWYRQFPPDDEMIWFDKTKQSGGKSFHLRKTEPIMIWGKVKEKFDWDIIEEQTDRGDGMRNFHTCPKPLDFMKLIIKKQTKENDIILDPFCGSGSTLMACEQTRRICYAMEIDEKYCSVIIKRWELFTGEKAVKVSG